MVVLVYASCIGGRWPGCLAAYLPTHLPTYPPIYPLTYCICPSPRRHCTAKYPLPCKYADSIPAPSPPLPSSSPRPRPRLLLLLLPLPLKLQPPQILILIPTCPPSSPPPAVNHKHTFPLLSILQHVVHRQREIRQTRGSGKRSEDSYAGVVHGWHMIVGMSMALNAAIRLFAVWRLAD